MLNLGEKCSKDSLIRWAQQTIGHDSNCNEQKPSLVPANPGHMNTHPYTQSNKISNLISPNNGVDSMAETKCILAYIILKELGQSFEGAERLAALSDAAPACAHEIYLELGRIPTEKREGIKNLTEMVPLDPRSYQQHLKKIYKAFTSSPQHDSSCPRFSFVIVMIAYVVDLCRRFLENDCGNEIPSIHGVATRLMLDQDTPLSPANWSEWMEADSQKHRPPLERRPSMAWEFAGTVLSLLDAYTRHTR